MSIGAHELRQELPHGRRQEHRLERKRAQVDARAAVRNRGQVLDHTLVG